jgi:Domain of unknown function (DUF4157)/DNA/RNA non-specific endonuclease
MVMQYGAHKPNPTSSIGGVLQRKCACGGTPGPTGECAACKKKREASQGMLQRAASNASQVNEVPGIVHDVLRSPGQPLETNTRAFMESRFGEDFSGVRVHTDSRAAESARAVNALAYTVGQNVVFDSGRYAPQTQEGQKLIAHELTHTIQQRAQASGPQTQTSMGVPGDGFEQEADRIANQVVSNQPRVFKPGLLIPPTTVQRYSVDEFVEDVTTTVESVENVVDQAVDGVTDLASDTVDGVADLASDAIDTIASEALSTANALATVLGGSMTISGSRVTIAVPAFDVAGALVVEQALESMSYDLASLEGDWPIGTDLFVYGAIGLRATLERMVSGQIGPLTINGLRIEVDLLTGDFGAAGSITINRALGLTAEVRLGAFGEAGLMILWPDPPMRLHAPVIGVEAGLSGLARGIITAPLTFTGSLSSVGGVLSMAAGVASDLGLGLDLGLAGYGQLTLLGQNLCTLYWPLWEKHLSTVISTEISAGLSIGPGGVSGSLDVSAFEIDQIPFDSIPLEIQREVQHDDCPLCNVFYELGLMPSQNGGEWKGHPTPPLDGPLEVFPRDPKIASGSKCRGACGENCEKCRDAIPEETIVTEVLPNGTARRWEYNNLVVCNTHEGCKEHDAGYDWCADGGETNILGPCHRLPDLEAVCHWGIKNAVTWVILGQPRTGTMFFADSVTVIDQFDPSIEPENQPQQQKDACEERLNLRPGINDRWHRQRSPIAGQTTVLSAAFRLDRGIAPPIGQDTTEASRKWVRSIGLPKDDAGHVIANRFGGRANFNSSEGNIFPQDLSFNRGTMNSYDNLAADLHNGNCDVCVNIGLMYRSNSDLRPYATLYTILYRSPENSGFNPPIGGQVPNR